MSRPARNERPLPAAEAPAPARPGTRGDSVPVGTIWLSGLVKTTNGYCVAQLELPAELWERLEGKKSLGTSQTFPEHIASQHKRVVMALSQKTQFQRSRFK